ncbi:MAG: YCF48-related protein [Ignavibacteria bacterium]|jgi:hypothetical protein
MKKRVLLSIIIILFSYEQTNCQWRVIDTNSDVEEFVEITFSDSLNGWALADKAIFHTNDGGDTWVSQISVDSMKYRQIISLDNQVGLAFGRGIILRTNDGGINWNIQNVFPNNYNYMIASFCNDSTGLMIAAKEENEKIYKFVLKTYDRGLSWDTLLVKNDIIRFYDIAFADSSTGYIMGSVGLDNFPQFIFIKQMTAEKIGTVFQFFTVHIQLFYLWQVRILYGQDGSVLQSHLTEVLYGILIMKLLMVTLHTMGSPDFMIFTRLTAKWVMLEL